MQPLNQNPFTKIASFDGHSAAHRNIPNATDVRRESEVLQPCASFDVRLFSAIPYGAFYVLLLHTAWHAFTEVFVLDVFYNTLDSNVL